MRFGTIRASRALPNLIECQSQLAMRRSPERHRGRTLHAQRGRLAEMCVVVAASVVVMLTVAGGGILLESPASAASPAESMVSRPPIPRLWQDWTAPWPMPRSWHEPD